MVNLYVSINFLILLTISKISISSSEKKLLFIVVNFFIDIRGRISLPSDIGFMFLEKSIISFFVKFICKIKSKYSFGKVLFVLFLLFLKDISILYSVLFLLGILL